MKKIIIGILIGVFICVSLFEIIHKTVEVDGSRTCAVIYDKLTERWHGNFVYQLKVVYKVFAFPVKTTWILLSDEGIATMERGKDWRFKRVGRR